MNIDKPTMKEPMIPDPPLGAPPLQEVQGDPRGGDGGGGGGRWTRDGTERGFRRNKERRKLGASGQDQTGHARYAAEKPIWKMNKVDGTWRRCDHSSVSEALASVKLRSERPWEDQSDGDSVLTIVSIADPSNYNHPVHYPTDIQKKSRSKGNTKDIFYYPYISLLHLDRYEEERVKSSKVFVERVNRLSREKPGGAVFHNLGVSLEDAGRHCPMCRLRGCCLGPNCLGYSGIFHIT